MTVTVNIQQSSLLVLEPDLNRRVVRVVVVGNVREIILEEPWRSVHKHGGISLCGLNEQLEEKKDKQETST